MKYTEETISAIEVLNVIFGPKRLLPKKQSKIKKNNIEHYCKTNKSFNPVSKIRTCE